MIVQDYVAIDLEMTGLNAKRDSILEIGAVRVEHKQVVAEYEALINPHHVLAAEVTALTGITDDMASKGRELDEVFPEIVDFCGDSVLLGHNVIFDYAFLKQAASNRKAAFDKIGIDTLKIARKLLPQEEKKTLQHLCDYYGICRERKHRALDDARAARALYEIFETKYEADTPDLFCPYPLVYKAKRQSPATNKQKKQLQGLIDYHGLKLELPWDVLTKNEASRQIDKIISQYGRMP